MNSKLPLYLLVLTVFFTSCKKDLVGFKSKKKDISNIEEIDFDYFQTRTKVRYAEGDKQVNGNANIRIRKDSLIWFSTCWKVKRTSNCGKKNSFGVLRELG